MTMGIGPSQARGLSYWEYSALLRTWNARHDPDGEQEAVAPPADGYVRERQARLAERGITSRRPAAGVALRPRREPGKAG